MKKILLSAAVVAVAVCGVFTANQVNNEVAMNDLQLENVEALASGEDSWHGCKDKVGHYCTDPWGHHISFDAKPRR